MTGVATRDRSCAAADRLLSALAAARDAFEREDAIAASAALDAVVTACAELDAAGARLGEETLAQARQLHLACATAALAAQVSLNEKLEQAAGARRAARAYGG
jgi:hypothetical protein